MKMERLMVETVSAQPTYWISTSKARMFGSSPSPKIRGSGHVVLNVLRAFNITGLLAVAASNWVIIIKTGLPNQYAFFSDVADVLTSFIALFLVVSEIQWPKKWFQGSFQRTWPVLSASHGFSYLGLAMIMMGCQILGTLNQPAGSVNNLSLPLWRLVLASGVLSLIFGFFNVISSLIFSDRKNNITARMIRSDGNLAAAPVKENPDDYYSTHSTHSASVYKEEQQQPRKSIFGMRLPIRASKMPDARSYNISGPMSADVDELPRHNQDVNVDWRAGPKTVGGEDPSLQPPNPAHHPAYRETRYSEVSDMTRF